MEKIQLNLTDKKMLTETFVVFRNLKLLSQLPKEIQTLLIDNYEKKYEFNYNIKIPLYEYNLEEFTSNMIAYLYIKYICKDSEEKEKLIKKLKNTEIDYKENSEIDIFQGKGSTKEKNENKDLVDYNNNELHTNVNVPIPKVKNENKIISCFKKILKLFKKQK